MSNQSDYNAWMNFLVFFGGTIVVVFLIVISIGYLAGWWN